GRGLAARAAGAGRHADLRASVRVCSRERPWPRHPRRIRRSHRGTDVAYATLGAARQMSMLPPRRTSGLPTLRVAAPSGGSYGSSGRKVALHALSTPHARPQSRAGRTRTRRIALRSAVMRATALPPGALLSRAHWRALGVSTRRLAGPELVTGFPGF